MRNSDASRRNDSSPSGALIQLGLGVAVLVALMVAYVYYPYPSGKRPDVLSFVAFWFREILILGIAVLVLVIAGSTWLTKRRRKQEGEDAT